MYADMNSGIADDVTALRMPVLATVGKMGVMAAWIWGAALGPWLAERGDGAHLLAPLLLLVASLVCLGRRGYRVRGTVFSAGLAASLCVAYGTTTSTSWVYYGALAIGVTSLLLGNAAALAMAAALTAAVLAILGQPIVVALAQLWAPLGLVWISAGTSGLSTKTLYTATHWAMHSQSQAWVTAREVQQRRAELRRALDSLTTTYDLLLRTSRELVWARREAEHARQAKARFVANISHELRTPLNVITGFASVLCLSPEEYEGVCWTPALRQDVFSIWRNAEHVLDMIDDILDLAQIEASRLPIVAEPTELVAFLRDVSTDGHALLRDKPLELRLSLPDEPLWSVVDRTRIRQVLLNLINNAARFTTQGFIEIAARRQGDEAIVHVRDTGIGIPGDRLDVIFDEFEQVDTAQVKSDGVGLGLAISREFIALHGGRMWVESTLGEGSTFSFALPLEQEGTTSLPSRLRALPAGRTAATVEEQPLLVHTSDSLLPRMFERHLGGRRILATSSLREALSLVETQHPRGVIIAADAADGLDRAMDTARTLVRHVAPTKVPTIVGWFPTERGTVAGLEAQHVLIKPVTRDELVSAIRSSCPVPGCVLAVDDEPDMVRFLRRAIVSAWPACQVLTAESGQRALELAALLPDVILLDLLLPDLRGSSVLDALRADTKTADIPVIVVTARGSTSESSEERQGNLHVMRNGGYSASEAVRLVEAILASLPTEYTTADGDRPGSSPDPLGGPAF